MASRRRIPVLDDPKQEKTCFSVPSVYHAAIVIFLEFFAFGLLTTPMISVLDETFPKHTFLMNGIIQGVKGFLSFLSAPLLGALSDAIGRKPFLLLTVTFTCSPIPLMKISHWWYFTMISISGVFAVTFSVVLAYVADITSEDDRSWGYGLVSATFAASLVSSPAIGAYLGRVYSEDLVVALATAIAFLDIFFIMACVPESLPEKVRASHMCSITGRGSGSGGSNTGKLSWDKIDPFAALRKISNDYLVLMVCITTFFSYLPEAGQYSCFFVYLRLVMGFSEENVALFIALVGILSCISQTLFLGVLNRLLGAKRAIIVGLVFEAIQLTLYGFATQPSLLWTAGFVAAMGMVTYPALSAFVSKHAAADQQGVAQGLVTGIRGLCGGLGPALFGLIFYIFQVDLHSQTPDTGANVSDTAGLDHLRRLHAQILPGPPFAFGAVLVLLAILVSLFIPENPKSTVTKIIPIPLSGDSSGPIAAEAYEQQKHRARRGSPSLEFGHGFDSENECDLYSTSRAGSKALLLDPKNHPKHTRFIADWDEKDHTSAAGVDFGLWGRLTSSWSERRRPQSIASRRAYRMSRQQTATYSFTRAHLVEPIRRFIGSGWSALGNRSPDTSYLISNRSAFDHTAFSSGHGITAHLGTAISSDHGISKKPEPLPFLLRPETEVADLSNYRSHNLKHFLHQSNSPYESEVVTAHRFDMHNKTRVFDTQDNTALATTAPGNPDEKQDNIGSSGLFVADASSTVADEFFHVPDNSDTCSLSTHHFHPRTHQHDDSVRLAVLPT